MGAKNAAARGGNRTRNIFSSKTCEDAPYQLGHVRYDSCGLWVIILRC